MKAVKVVVGNAGEIVHVKKAQRAESDKRKV